MTNTVLVEIDHVQKLSKELFASSLFESKNPAQLFAKILAGKELGLEPIASITGINIVQGKPVLGANLIASLIARHPVYKYKVLKSDDKICEIAVYEHNELVGSCSFTIQEAMGAGLINKDNWKKYPSDMLFARCISRAARRFAPGIFGGAPVYTPDEISDEHLELDLHDHVESKIIDSEVIELCTQDQIDKFDQLCFELCVSKNLVDEKMKKKKFNSIQEVTFDVMQKWINELNEKKIIKETEVTQEAEEVL